MFLRPLLFCLILFPFIVDAQTTTLEIINVDKTIVDENLFPGAQKLLGNIQFRQGNATMSCDSGLFYPDSSKIIAQGRVTIMQENFKGTSQQLEYYGTTGDAILSGKVILTENGQMLKAPLVRYNTLSKIAQFDNTGEIFADGLYAKSQKGIFYRNESKIYLIKQAKLKKDDLLILGDTIGYQIAQKKIFFFHNTQFEMGTERGQCHDGFYQTDLKKGALFQKVKLLDSLGRIVYCDTLFFSAKPSFQEIIGPFLIIDPAQKMEISANYLKRWPDKDSMIVERQVLLKLKSGDDTTKIACDFLKFNQQSIQCCQNVHFYSDSILGRSDSLMYYRMDSVAKFWGNPVMWSHDFQITGDTLQIWNEINFQKYLRAFPNGSISQEVDWSHANQIKADSIIILMGKQGLQKVCGFNQIETIFYQLEGKKLGGETYVSAHDFTIYWNQSKLQSITYSMNPKMELNPTNKIGRKLPGISIQRKDHFQEKRYWEFINGI